MRKNKKPVKIEGFNQRSKTKTRGFRASLVLLFILIAFSLSAEIELSMSSSFRSCNDLSQPYDYQYLLELYHPNIELRYEKEREVGKYYDNYYIKLMQKWKYVEVNALRNENEAQAIDLSQVDVRYRWNRNWLQSATFGVAQRWKFGIPYTDLVVGKEINFEFRLFLMPTKIKFSADTFTHNFKQFDYETRTVIDFELNPDIAMNVAELLGKDINIPKVNFIIKTWLREINNEKYWQTRLEFRIRI